MTAGLVDLRSDTVTRPTPAMRAAMAAAEVGDDVYGEDPTVAALEERVAGLLGQPAALFTPTGSLANQLGVRLLVRPGEEVLCESTAHIVRAELGGHAAFGGVTTRTWTASSGRLVADDVRRAVMPPAGPFLVSTGVVSVENTHNFGGGTISALDELRALHGYARAGGFRLHLDGARLWNAHVATGTPLQDYGELFDAITVCLSKGLGAPVGSLVVGSAELIEQARWWRKRMGAGMRQVGILAAAGLYALDHHLERLADDHRRAAELARLLAEVGAAVAPVDTNIVVVDLGEDGLRADQICAAARSEGVLVGGLGPRWLRLVTHLDVDDADCAQAASVLIPMLKR
ncbi:MAG TPA: GntG family PLP-dependent aldolase [Sporichthyaceae bacterium]|jgi:threonine aldolase|nr:GntG family PLP-dependent aldolase [Sporichthyaceae bacterium]